jgi:hypothetical protein
MDNMDIGIQSALGQEIPNPLPPSWLGRSDAPPNIPSWANIYSLSSTQVRCLQAQIAYDASIWNYSKINASNQVGRYQFTPEALETYGLLAPGSNAQYGSNCINYLHCWKPNYVNQNIVSPYQNYFYNIISLQSFLTNTVAQEHLGYQRLVDLYIAAVNSQVILSSDTPDIVAGMIYVCWTLGVGSPSTPNNQGGSGAWAWRYLNVGDYGDLSFNSGRYAVTVLSS